jgi:hypothetical protein
LEGCIAATARSAGAGAIAEPRKARSPAAGGGCAHLCMEMLYNLSLQHRPEGTDAPLSVWSIWR